MKYAPKISHTPRLIKQFFFFNFKIFFFNFNPSQIIIILRLNLPTPPPPPPPSPLKKLSSHRFPHTYFTCWISSSGTNITSNDSNESFEESSGSLDSELVSSLREFGDSSSSTASLALGFPHAWLRTQEFLSD